MTKILLSQPLLSIIALVGLISPIVLPYTLGALADELAAKEWARVLNDPNCAPNEPLVCDLGGDIIAMGVACFPVCIPAIYIPAIVGGVSLKQRLRRQGNSIRMWQTLGIAFGGFTIGYILLGFLIVLVY